jgi:pimeloyl-ACP methyl ester carboxylesterase
MQPQEVRAVGRLGVHAYAGAVSHIEKAHCALASLSFKSIPAAAPLQPVHDAVARTAYRAVRGIGSLAGTGASEALALAATGPGHKAMGSTGRSNHAQAALNAAVGDRLSEEDNPLAIRMALRSGGHDIAIDTASFNGMFPVATPKIAVFVHGFGEADDSWRLNSGQGRETYGRRLAAELGYCDLYVRYNTGRHVSHNGRDLSQLLSELPSAWPVSLEEILLVGHSMGGLVIRSATHYGDEDHAAWVPLVRHIFLLGSPNLGAPLARLTHIPARAAAKQKDRLPFAPLLTTRSGGVDDLRFGYLLDEDWDGCDSATCPADHRHDVPLLATADHYTVSATVPRTPGNPLGELVGDLLVQPASAHGRRRRQQHIAFDVENRHEFAGRHHFQLLNDQGVYAAIRKRLEASA